MPTTSDLPRPRLAKTYMRTAKGAEQRGATEHRQRLLAGLTGLTPALRFRPASASYSQRRASSRRSPSSSASPRAADAPRIAPPSRWDHRGTVEDRATERWMTVDQLLTSARAELARLTPAEALAAQQSGAALVDIRSDAQRSRDGEIPDAKRYPRNVLEWRLDPECEHCDRDLARRDVCVILICDEGFQSSLAAATVRRFGIDATDVIGGFQAWRAAGLPVDRLATSAGPVDRGGS
jgi:rhodanese-related sulfurtransferase